MSIVLFTQVRFEDKYVNCFEKFLIVINSTIWKESIQIATTRVFNRDRTNSQAIKRRLETLLQHVHQRKTGQSTMLYSESSKNETKSNFDTTIFSNDARCVQTNFTWRIWSKKLSPRKLQKIIVLTRRWRVHKLQWLHGELLRLGRCKIKIKRCWWLDCRTWKPKFSYSWDTVVFCWVRWRWLNHCYVIVGFNKILKLYDPNCNPESCISDEKLPRSVTMTADAGKG